MKNVYLLLLAFFGFGSFAFSQKVSGTVKGSLQDSVSATALEDATVSVMALPDSTLISFTLSRSNGSFEIKNLAPGNYQVVASFVGLHTFKKKFTISAAHTEEDLGIVKLQRADKALDEITIVEAPVKVNGDTVSFKADAFKTKPNATVEDLLKKLPGVQVDRDGTVKAQGENVQKVYVDGKEFFNNDPKLATKNLTADMVDRVEVYDDMSEQAKFNGIDDGSRSKAINLKLKKDKKKGLFGNVYAGAGTKDRYDANLSANYFKGATQANVIAKSNNINNIGFTLNDMMGMFGGGGMSGGNMGGGFFGGNGMTVVGGGRGAGGMNMSGMSLGSTTGGGITKSSQAGLNYRDTWSKHFDVNGSYFFNSAQKANDNTSVRQDLLQDSTITTSENTFSRSSNYNNRLNLNMVISIDSFNSIIFQPNLNVQKSETYSNDSLIAASSNKYLLNRGRTINSNAGDGYNWSNNLLWRRKFRKPGRTLSVALTNTLADNDRTSYTLNDLSAQRSDQMSTSQNKTNNYAVSVSYTEAIARDKILEFNYNHSDNRNESDRETFRKDSFGKYEVPVPTQTNLFENSNLYDRIGTNLRVVKKKYNYQLGFAAQQTTLESNNLSTKTAIAQRAINYFPTASFNYQFQRSRSLRVNYRGRTNQPTASQLQDVVNGDNPLYIYKGNPLLRQEFSHNITLSYNFFDVIKFRNLFAFLTFGTTENKISNAVEYKAGGVQVTQPKNISGVYNVSGNFNFGLPIKHLQGGNFNTNTRIGFNQDASFVNNVKNYSRNLSVTEDLRLSYNYKESLDMGISASVTYNQVRNTVQKNNNSTYYTHIYAADVTYTFPKGIILASDVDYRFNTGLASGYNQNYAIWNASVAKQVFKNQRGEIKFSAHDLLNQNISVYRTVNNNYIQDV
ncbi:MAG TPA: TonB-dependent receptor, partial [Flavisolibacter sp.]|nr:TonB-dependent receptor [Flavisolibacter sp.]